MRRLIALIMLAAAGLAVRPGWARAVLERAEPAVDGTVASAPRDVRMLFSEAIDPMFSGAFLSTASGKRITGSSAAAVDPQNPKQLVLPLPSLPPGRYRVRWYVVSVDAHRTVGSFEFEILP